MLKMLELEKGKQLDTMGEQITKTDWTIDSEREYVNTILPHIQSNVEPLFKRMNYLKFKFGSTWFQQYEKEDFHSWHRHPDTDWGLVYYLELPLDGPVTEFRNPLDSNETILPKVKEGDFVLFPALLEHRSSENNSKARKTVIVTNFKTF